MLWLFICTYLNFFSSGPILLSPVALAVPMDRPEIFSAPIFTKLCGAPERAKELLTSGASWSNLKVFELSSKFEFGSRMPLSFTTILDSYARFCPLLFSKGGIYSWNVWNLLKFSSCSPPSLDAFLPPAPPPYRNSKGCCDWSLFVTITLYFPMVIDWGCTGGGVMPVLRVFY